MDTEKILQQLLQDVSEIKAKLEMILKANSESKLDHSKRLEDHEKRIRFLERYAFVLIGAIILLQVLVKYL